MRFEIITSMERNEALSQVRNAISQSGGWVTNHSLFSNLSATVQFEIPDRTKDLLAQKLMEAGLKAAISGDWTGRANEDLRGTIAITFVHADGDLRRDVPAFG